MISTCCKSRHVFRKSRLHHFHFFNVEKMEIFAQINQTSGSTVHKNRHPITVGKSLCGLIFLRKLPLSDRGCQIKRLHDGNS